MFISWTELVFTDSIQLFLEKNWNSLREIYRIYKINNKKMIIMYNLEKIYGKILGLEL